MAKFTLGEATEDTGPIPEGMWLRAEVVSVSDPQAKKSQQGETYYKVNWKFLITEEGEFEGRTIYGETSEKFVPHPDCKLYAWSQEVLSAEFPPGFELDTDWLLRNECKIRTKWREYQKDGRDVIYVFVEDVMRLDSAVATAGGLVGAAASGGGGAAIGRDEEPF